MRATANAKEHVEEVAEDVAGQVRQYTDRAKELLHNANNTSLAEVEKGIGNYVKKNPGRSLLTAAAAGFVVGFMFRR